MYSTTTSSVTVSVEPTYLDNESAPEKNLYVWAYRVSIENMGQETLQLKTRYWKITDAFGRVQEVHGPGVVGEQPVLKPGEKFEYTSGTPLPTPSGIMTGTYSMQTDDGRVLDIAIPAFSLDTPHTPRQVN
jgi:ApaG protein